MAPVVVFPDTEGTVATYLQTELDARSQGATVRTKVPNPRPEKLVVVRRGGGPRRNIVVDQPQLDIECWAASEVEAHDLAQLTRALVNALPGSGHGVYRVEEFGGPAALPDPLSDYPRYVFTVSAHVRGTAEA